MSKIRQMLSPPAGDTPTTTVLQTTDLKKIVAYAETGGVTPYDIKDIVDGLADLQGAKQGRVMSKGAAAIANKFFIEYNVPAGSNKAPMLKRIKESMPEDKGRATKANLDDFVGVQLSSSRYAQTSAFINGKTFYVLESVMSQKPKLYGPFTLKDEAQKVAPSTGDKPSVSDLTVDQLDLIKTISPESIGVSGYGRLEGELRTYNNRHAILIINKGTPAEMWFGTDMSLRTARECEGSGMTIKGLISKTKQDTGFIEQAERIF